MKKRGISFAALAIVCAFIVTVALFAAGLYSDYQDGLQSCKTRFEKLSSRTAEASEIYASGSREFIRMFNSAVGTPDIYESVSLQVDGSDVYIYPDYKIPNSSVFVKSYSTRIVGGDGSDIRLSANLWTVTPAMIFYRAKIAFIVVLAGTLAACILLMYLYLAPNADGESDAADSAKFSDGGDNGSFTDSFDDGSDIDNSDNIDDVDEINNIDSSNNIDNIEGEQEKVDYNPLENAYEAQERANSPLNGESEYAEANAGGASESSLQAGNIPEADEAAEPEELSEAETASDGAAGSNDNSGNVGNSAADNNSNISSTDENTGAESESSHAAGTEQGLFSPASGFGWESYLTTRLGSELVRAASSEQDLSLVLISIPGMTQDSPYYGGICKVLLDFFQFKDFIFEYKNGFAAIIQNKDVDEAMKSAELLYTEITSALNSAGAGTKPLMGLSSRSLRLISAERIKTEAEQAVLHAAEDKDSPIVAFRVNPEKYRHYINGAASGSQ